jgi:hypothetical protein
MDSKNLIKFFLVGKTVRERQFILLEMTSTKKGWKQVSLNNDHTYDFMYENNEMIPELMNWFKIDFSQYRMFDDLVDAEVYLKNKSAA